MIQDIAPHQYRNEYQPTKPAANSILLCYKGRNLLLRREGEEVVYPTFIEAVNAGVDEGELYHTYTYLFTIDDRRFYLGSAKSGEALCEDSTYEWEDVSFFRVSKPKYLSFAGITGWQLSRWYETRRFCGRCGKPMVHDEKERMMRCPSCGLMEFPKICPAVIIAVTSGNKILMSKYAGREFKKYALLAGFN